MNDKNFVQGFSIVLCTYNGRSRLMPTLAHLAALALPNDAKAELILVDNASTDDTERFATSTWKDLGEPFPLRIMSEARPGKGYAVETGYDAARYSYIVTVDDDNWLQADYLVTAAELLKQHPDVGILQGHSVGVFEAGVPECVRQFESYFVVGGPIAQPGYFPANDYHVWGAGMVIRTADWVQLRRLGFAFLTSKVPGKAAGEDHETAIALLLLGRKIYYSDKLQYQHFMPAERINWPKLQQSFEVYGYVLYHLNLYSLVIDSYKKKKALTKVGVRKYFLQSLRKSFREYTLKQHTAYWIRPKAEYYQLRLLREYSYCKSFLKLSEHAMQDVNTLKKWMLPLLVHRSETFEWVEAI
ncbi:glycosyltransferase [Hymenobacter jejuensis]|uniref:Glycosyltransferase family 2 protein n=1 Tax=Hymenobacter jejuensis TaxID=2502781 RepID=A0A5B7ZWJ7_9BACT|nr:glycosyltransferase [Hymenobacter jejuensis]QDA59348.1 glycosyltransferase family 2 protein [Hymenobacter jejuensis]